MEHVDWSAIGQWFADLDWRNGPGLVSAVVAFAALIIASIGALAAWKQVTSTANQIAYRDDQDKRKQAEKVAVWITKTFEEDAGLDTRIDIHLLNKSGLPVFDLVARVAGDTDLEFRLVVLKPSDDVETRPWKSLSQAVLDAAKTIQYPDFFGRRAHMIAKVTEQEVVIEFRDMQNQEWVRDEVGRLRLKDGRVLRKSMKELAAEVELAISN